MLLVNVYIQALIVIAVVAIFLLSVILNYRTPVPKGVEMPEKCQLCPSQTCIIKISDIEKKKEELKDYLEDCEAANDNKKN